MADIKLALYGQVDNDTRIAYTFPEKYVPENPASADPWLRGLFDPRDARNFNTEKVYVFWHIKDQGNCYGMIIPSRGDSRDGRLLIALFVGPNVVRDGRKLITAFTALEDVFGTRKNFNPESAEIAKILSQITLAPDQLRTRGNASGDIGYRPYTGIDELAKILSNCDQKSYFPMRRILFVDRSALPPIHSAGYTEITAPIVVFNPLDGHSSPRDARPAPAPAPAPEYMMPPQPVRRSGKSPMQIVIYLVTIIVALYIIFAACCAVYYGVVPPFRSDKQTEQTEPVVEDQAKLEAEDSEYLYRNSTWDISRVKSEKYKELVNALVAGDVSKVTSRVWFSAAQENATWQSIIGSLNALGSFSESAKSAVINCSSGGKIDLLRLAQELDDLKLKESARQSAQQASQPAPAPRMSAQRPSSPQPQTRPSDPAPKKDKAKAKADNKPEGSGKKQNDKPASKPKKEPKRASPKTERGGID